MTKEKRTCAMARKDERDKVLDMVLEMSELCTLKEGIHKGYLQFTAIQYSVGRIRQAGEP